MTLLILSFVAGALTVAAPCVLPLLPVIVGGSLVRSKSDKASRQWRRPLIIALSLSASVIVFTLLIKATTALLGVPQMIWQIISGIVVILLGINYIWPNAWEQISSKGKFLNKSNSILGKAYQKDGIAGDILTGAALGPVFNSCSPTYALVVATVLPATYVQGLFYLAAYALGMSAVLLLVVYFGQIVVTKLGWLSKTDGWFKRTVGLLFILVGLSVILGFDKSVQAFVLEHGWYNPIGNFERNLTK